MKSIFLFDEENLKYITDNADYFTGMLSYLLFIQFSFKSDLVIVEKNRKSKQMEKSFSHSSFIFKQTTLLPRKLLKLENQLDCNVITAERDFPSGMKKY